ncbi:MAG TPA: GAF domain-containing protein, partial [Roseateles sp.]
QGLAALRTAELADEPPAAPVPAAPTPANSPPLRLRHYPRDHSVFINDEYLIKGVAGAILAKLVRDQIASGRDSFSTRELRLAGGDLGLPEVQDNLGVRLLLLERRLAERDFGMRIERTGRGLYRLIASGPLEIIAGE